jgi:Cft2 family RNA processing exonuclease
MLTVNKVIEAYLKLRSQKESIESEAKEKVMGIKEQMIKLEAWIKNRADEEGVDSFKTAKGTAFLTTTDFAQVADWDATLEFIKDNDAYDLLEKRVSKKAVRGYIEEEKVVPSGVNYGTRIDINVRKPANKVED